VGIVVACFDQHVVCAVGDYGTGTGPSICSIDSDAGAGAGEAVGAAGVAAAADDGAGRDVINFKLNLTDAIGVGGGCLHVGECAADDPDGRVAYGEGGSIESGEVSAAC